MLALAAGIAVTSTLVLLVALVSGGASEVKSSGRPSLGPQHRWLAALNPLSVAAGTSAALGILHGNALLLIGALIGCMYVRWNLSSSAGSAGLLPGFLAVSWAVLCGFLRFETFDTEALLGAQTVLGPAVLLTPTVASAAAGVAMIAGVAGGFQWVSSLPAVVPASLDRPFGWTEVVVAGSVVSATLWGPSLGALLNGGTEGISATLLSLAVSAVCILSIAAGVRLFRKALQGRVTRWVPAALSLGASLLTVLAR